MEGFLGIDVSKGYCDVFLIGPDFRQLGDTARFLDTRRQHDLLDSWIRDAMARHGLSLLNCAVESTGGFENNWHSFLVGLGAALPVKVARLNPNTVKNASAALLRPNVTDALSAQNIAEYLVRYRDQVDYRVADKRYASFRSLVNHTVLVTRQRTQLVNECKQVLYTAFPELLRFCKKAIPKPMLCLLGQYPSAMALSRARLEDLVAIKGITLDKAVLLVASAKGSVASRSTGTDEFLIQSMMEAITHKDMQLKRLKGRLAKDCQGPEVELLKTITGVGAYSAALLMAEIEDIGRFPSPGKLAAYFGLHPKLKESGDKKSVARMSKKGRPGVRAALYMCAQSAVMHDDNMKSIYARHRANGKKHNQAIGVIMHKILRTAWGVLTSEKAYDPQIDKGNQDKCSKKAEEAKATPQKQIQGESYFDPEAPLSRRAAKKMKAATTSQPGHAGNVRDLVQQPPMQT